MGLRITNNYDYDISHELRKCLSYLCSVDNSCTEDQEDAEFVDDVLVGWGDGGLVLEQDQADHHAGDH